MMESKKFWKAAIIGCFTVSADLLFTAYSYSLNARDTLVSQLFSNNKIVNAEPGDGGSNPTTGYVSSPDPSSPCSGYPTVTISGTDYLNSNSSVNLAFHFGGSAGNEQNNFENMDIEFQLNTTVPSSILKGKFSGWWGKEKSSEDRIEWKIVGEMNGRSYSIWQCDPGANNIVCGETITNPCDYYYGHMLDMFYSLINR